ncbi:MAG: hypothetical protein NZ521_11715 [Flammeovirgaceae bacterium]|nr:hypothetical protein [Flammeovirgaceae bacterium]MDW8288950.1 hypothetical protein [Flammeovirgaceae bacterium]
MKNFLKKWMISMLVVGLFSCMGQHNKFPSENIAADDTRIYGNIGGEPLQLKNKYPDPDEKTTERVAKIREKMFPK